MKSSHIAANAAIAAKTCHVSTKESLLLGNSSKADDNHISTANDRIPPGEILLRVHHANANDDGDREYMELDISSRQLQPSETLKLSSDSVQSVDAFQEKSLFCLDRKSIFRRWAICATLSPYPFL